MKARERLIVSLLLAGATIAVVVLLVVATRACPAPTDTDPCPSAATNRAVVVGLASAAVALGVTPFAFLAEYATRRRIVYRGAWTRAARRGAVASAIVAILAGLRLGGALSGPLAAAVVIAPIALEAYVTRNELHGGPAA